MCLLPLIFYIFITSTSQILKFGNFMLRRTFFQAWPIKDNRHCLRVNCQENFFSTFFSNYITTLFLPSLLRGSMLWLFRWVNILDHQLCGLSASLEEKFWKVRTISKVPNTSTKNYLIHLLHPTFFAIYASHQD